MRTLKTSAAALGLSLLLGGCALVEQPNYTSVSANDFVAANYRAADALQAQLAGKLAGDQPLIMATLVNIDALEHSSMLGRVVSEQIATRLAQGGLPVLEMKLRNSVYLKRNQGELMLTRELGEVAGTHNAQAVVVGSYAETRDTIFINVKVIQPTTNLVLAGHDYVLAKQGTIRSMLVPD
ncbi:FlgO family outer membrane protein [Massilia oculi]|uniref:FlgO family outer membrane protein n=1 Tax=Massilia oculi TaxID=945844 RepID=UPI0028A96732|nr:FlgO family outer membrane protein [Massilia oculi]